MLKVTAPITNIPSDTLAKYAEIAVQNALNSDWRNRGKLLRASPIKNKLIISPSTCESMATAVCAYFKFEKPSKDEWASQFNGFVLALISIDGNYYYEAYPVIRSLEDKDFDNAVNRFKSRFCPCCKSIDTINQKIEKKQPEVVFYKYTCSKCKHTTHDVFD